MIIGLENIELFLLEDDSCKLIMQQKNKMIDLGNKQYS